NSTGYPGDVSTEKSAAHGARWTSYVHVKNSLSVCFYTYHIAHAITSGGHRLHPERGGQRPPGEYRPIQGPVGQRQLLARTGEDHRVLPDDVPGAHGGKADLPVAACPCRGGFRQQRTGSAHARRGRTRGGLGAGKGERHPGRA